MGNKLAIANDWNKLIRHAVPNSGAMQHYLIKRTRRKLTHLFSLLIAEKELKNQQQP